MKAKILGITLIVLILTIPNTASGQEKIGVGGQLFSPTGITLKADLDNRVAVTGVTGFVLRDDFSSITLQANLILKNKPDDIEVDLGEMYFYYGGGIQVTLQETFANTFSIRAPIGIEYEFESNPLGIYMDLAPVIDVEPNVVFYLSSSLGFRYYFN